MVYQLTLTGLVLGSTITVFEAGTTNVLAQSIDHGATSFVYTYSDGGFNIRIVIGAIGYAQTILTITAPSADTTLPVGQTVDRSLLIPVSAAAAARKAIDAISPAEVEALLEDFEPTDPGSITPESIGAESVANKGQPGGYASLDGSGQIPAAQIPSIAITEFLGTAANESAMLALAGQRGDWCVRTDTGTAWIITGTDPTVLAGWAQFVYPAAPVSSVAGRVGAVTLSTADVSGLGNSATRNVGTTPGTVAAGDDPRLGDARAPTAHTHPLSDLQQSGAATGQVAQWNGSAWVPATPSAGGGAPNVRWIGAGELIPRVTDGAGIDGQEFATNRQNLDYLAFDAGTTEFAQASFAWSGAATTATARLYWTAASGSGAVVWRVALRCYADDDAIDQSFGTAQSVTDTLLAAGDVHQTNATSAITPAGTPDNRRLTIVQVDRHATDGADTLAVDARLIGVLLEFA